MCLSSPKPPPPTAAAPIVAPVEAPTLQIAPSRPGEATRKRGASALRIDRTAHRPDHRVGLHIPME